MTEARGLSICPISGVTMLLRALAGAPAERRRAERAFFDALDDALVARAALAFAGRFAEGEMGEAYGIS
jgi:hypothetical protein